MGDACLARYKLKFYYMKNYENSTNCGKNRFNVDNPEAGVGIHEIMERLGHQDDEITKRVYLHDTKTMKKKPPKNSMN